MTLLYIANNSLLLTYAMCILCVHNDVGKVFNSDFDYENCVVSFDFSWKCASDGYPVLHKDLSEYWSVGKTAETMYHGVGAFKYFCVFS